MSFVAFANPGTDYWTYLVGDWQPIDYKHSLDGFVVSNFSGDFFLLTNSQKVESIEDDLDNYAELDSQVETKCTYIENVTKLVEELSSKEYQKIVYSRSKFVASEKKVSALTDSLLKSDLGTFRYIMQAPNGELWIGASPETLISQKNGVGESMALAGSQKNTTDSLAEYIWGAKEMDEHNYVVDFISNVMSELGLKYVIESTRTAIAGPVVHLKTRFKEIQPLDELNDLLSKLHPTPAICGIPVGKTKDRILEIESRDRSYYTGLIGLIQRDSSDVFINLRSMKKVKNGYELFLGGGITKDSIPEDEWSETEVKALTLLNIIS